jgi:hypothetical protein
VARHTVGSAATAAAAVARHIVGSAAAAARHIVGSAAAAARHIVGSAAAAARHIVGSVAAAAAAAARQSVGSAAARAAAARQTVGSAAGPRSAGVPKLMEPARLTDPAAVDGDAPAPAGVDWPAVGEGAAAALVRLGVPAGATALPMLTDAPAADAGARGLAGGGAAGSAWPAPAASAAGGGVAEREFVRGVAALASPARRGERGGLPASDAGSGGAPLARGLRAGVRRDGEAGGGAAAAAWASAAGGAAAGAGVLSKAGGAGGALPRTRGPRALASAGGRGAGEGVRPRRRAPGKARHGDATQTARPTGSTWPLPAPATPRPGGPT